MFRRRIRYTDEQKTAMAAQKAAHEGAQRECQICERNQCISSKGLMVLHGYKRPGYGFIEGSCFGVGHVDYSKGTDALELYATELSKMLTSAKADLATYTRGEVTHFVTLTQERAKDERGHGIYTGRNGRTPVMLDVYTSWAPGVSNADLYAKHLQAKQAAAALRVEQIGNELGRVQRRIAAWVAPA